MTAVEGILLSGDRVVVPESLHAEVLGTLHSGHQGIMSMLARGASSVWWPNMQEAVAGVRASCQEGHGNALSQPKEPPVEPPKPEYPFQQICGDYFSLRGHQYLVLVDRYSGWPSIHRPQKGGNAGEVLKVLQGHCENFGVPEELSTDRGSQFVAQKSRDFMGTWGIKNRVSSAMSPHSNTRAELAVKTVKRMIVTNVGNNGKLDTTAVGRALMQYRNTPDRDTERSPAQVVFGGQLGEATTSQGGSG
jgi:hypothetical protein